MPQRTYLPANRAHIIQFVEEPEKDSMLDRSVIKYDYDLKQPNRNSETETSRNPKHWKPVPRRERHCTVPGQRLVPADVFHMVELLQHDHRELNFNDSQNNSRNSEHLIAIR
jgi:hypothetical protein